MVREHHWLSGHELEQTPEDSRIGKPDMLKSMGSQNVREDLITEQQQYNSLSPSEQLDYFFIFLHYKQFHNNEVKIWVTHSCLTLCDSMGCSLPGSSVLRILQARMLKRVAISFSKGSSQLKDQTWVSCFADRFSTIWAMREAPKKKVFPDWE